MFPHFARTLLLGAILLASGLLDKQALSSIQDEDSAEEFPAASKCFLSASLDDAPSAPLTLGFGIVRSLPLRAHSTPLPLRR